MLLTGPRRWSQGEFPGIMDLTQRAPWHEAITYQNTWPHEYVMAKRDGQEALLAAFCERITQGEVVVGRRIRAPVGCQIAGVCADGRRLGRRRGGRLAVRATQCMLRARRDRHSGGPRPSADAAQSA